MRTSTIAEAKNNLSHLIHQSEAGEAIHLTRYGKPVAVIISEHHYQNLVAPDKSLNTAILHWRSQMPDSVDPGLNDSEIKALREESVEREFSWEE